MDDEKIIALLFDRNTEAITALDESIGPACRRLAKNILASDADAEECVNDAYLAAWNAIPPERPLSLRAYVFRIVRNLSVKRYHANTAQKRNSFYDAALDELAEVIPAPDNAEDALAAKELAALLDGFLDALDPTARVIFVRRYWYADSVTDIAAALGMRPGAVSARLTRTRKRLRSYLSEEGYEL